VLKKGKSGVGKPLKKTLNAGSGEHVLMHVGKPHVHGATAQSGIGNRISAEPRLVLRQTCAPCAAPRHCTVSLRKSSRLNVHLEVYFLAGHWYALRQLRRRLR
jgi:hypothetical protein